MSLSEELYDENERLPDEVMFSKENPYKKGDTLNHTSKVERMQRLEKVWELRCNGYNAIEIAKKLKVNKNTVNSDFKFLAKIAQEKLRSFLDEEYPVLTYQTLESLGTIKKYALEYMKQEKGLAKANFLKIALEANQAIATVAKEGPIAIQVSKIEEKYIAAVKALEEHVNEKTEENVTPGDSGVMITGTEQLEQEKEIELQEP